MHYSLIRRGLSDFFGLLLDVALVHGLLNLFYSLGNVLRLIGLRLLWLGAHSCQIQLGNLVLVLLVVTLILNLGREQLITEEVGLDRLPIRLLDDLHLLRKRLLRRSSRSLLLHFLELLLEPDLLLLLTLQYSRNLSVFVALRVSNHLLDLFDLQTGLMDLAALGLVVG